MLDGDTAITPFLGRLALPRYSPIRFKKTLQLAGFGGLTDVKLLTAPDFSTSNATAVRVQTLVSVMNPSVISVEGVGDIEFALLYSGSSVGTMTTRDVALRSGESR
jgi:hypothetical protein